MNEVSLNFNDGIITPTAESDKAKSNGHASRTSEALPEMVWTEDDLTLKLTETYPDLRYVDDWKRWMCYRVGGVWRKDNTRCVFDRAKEICRGASEGIDPKETGTLKWLRSAKTRAALRIRREKILDMQRSQNSGIRISWFPTPRGEPARCKRGNYVTIGLKTT